MATALVKRDNIAPDELRTPAIDWNSNGQVILVIYYDWSSYLAFCQTIDNLPNRKLVFLKSKAKQQPPRYENNNIVVTMKDFKLIGNYENGASKMEHFMGVLSTCRNLNNNVIVGAKYSEMEQARSFGEKHFMLGAYITHTMVVNLEDKDEH